MRTEAVISLSAPTSDGFIQLNLGGQSDPVADNQANRVDIELVGNEYLGAFYLGSNDGNVFIRTRVSGENGNPDGVQSGYTYIGIDVTGDGALDYWIEHGGTPNQSISILDVGATANDSPSTVSLGAVATFGGVSATTSVQYFDTAVGADNTGANSYFEMVEVIDLGLFDESPGGDEYDPYDLDAGGMNGDEDRFLTFSFDFSMLASVIIEDAEEGRFGEDSARLELFDESYGISWLLVTSQNGQNINSDFGGLDGNDPDFNPDTPFVDQPYIDENGDTQIGSGLTGGYTPGGDEAPVPEPATYALLFGLVALGFAAYRRRR